MSSYDYIVIGVYLVFMLSLGPIYKSFSKTASDFFRTQGKTAQYLTVIEPFEDKSFVKSVTCG